MSLIRGHVCGFKFQVCMIIPEFQSSCEFEKIFGQGGNPLDSERVG